MCSELLPRSAQSRPSKLKDAAMREWLVRTFDKVVGITVRRRLQEPISFKTQHAVLHVASTWSQDRFDVVMASDANL
jgi:hypothetical protein